MDTYTLVPSGDTATPDGLVPTVIVRITDAVVVSSPDTLLEAQFAT